MPAKLFRPSGWRRRAQAPDDPRAADIYSYEVTLVEEGGTYTVTGSPATGETAAVLDQLVNEILRRRKRE